jgi:hypothetical protein
MLNKNLKPKFSNAPQWPLLIALVILLVSTCSFADDPANITIKTASSSLQNDVFLLSAKIDYVLSDEANEALHNGVTLTFNVDLSIIEPRNWLWNKHRNSITLPYQIKYHTLAETYQVSNISNSSQHNFSSLTAALYALGSLNETPIHAITIPRGYNANVSISAYLNIEALPLPMRPMAYITPGWYLRSDSVQWPLNP